MPSKAKKHQVQAMEPAQDLSGASDLSLDNNTDLSQEVRLAEAQPGDIEALEQALDEAYENNNTLVSQVDELEEALCTIEPVLILAVHQRRMIDFLLNEVNRLKTSPASLIVPSGQMPDRKAQALMLLNPNGQSTWPGPPVTIKDLAAAMQITSKNVSSVLSGLRDQGYHIATDNLGRKFISNYTPGQSAKQSRFTTYEANTSAITSTELTDLISKANQTIVKRTVNADGTTTIKPIESVVAQ